MGLSSINKKTYFSFNNKKALKYQNLALLIATSLCVALLNPAAGHTFTIKFDPVERLTGGITRNLICVLQWWSINNSGVVQWVL